MWLPRWKEPSRSIQRRWIEWQPLKKLPLVQSRQRGRLQRNRLISWVLGGTTPMVQQVAHGYGQGSAMQQGTHLMYLQRYLNSLPVRFSSSQTYLTRQRNNDVNVTQSVSWVQGSSIGFNHHDIALWNLKMNFSLVLLKMHFKVWRSQPPMQWKYHLPRSEMCVSYCMFTEQFQDIGRQQIWTHIWGKE